MNYWTSKSATQNYYRIKLLVSEWQKYECFREYRDGADRAAVYKRICRNAFSLRPTHYLSFRHHYSPELLRIVAQSYGLYNEWHIHCLFRRSVSRRSTSVSCDLRLMMRSWQRLRSCHTSCKPRTAMPEVSEWGYSSGVARILLKGGTGAWRTGSEVRGDKVIQKWKPSGVRSAKTNMDEVFLQHVCHSNWWLWRSNFELTELGRKISAAIVWTAAKFACICKLQGARAPVPHAWRSHWRLAWGTVYRNEIPSERKRISFYLGPGFRSNGLSFWWA